MRKTFAAFLIFFKVFALIDILEFYNPFSFDFLQGYQILLSVTAVIILTVTALLRPYRSLSLILAFIAYAIMAGIMTIFNQGHSQLYIYIIEAGLVLLIASLAVLAGTKFHQQIQKEEKQQNDEEENGIYHYKKIQTIIESEFARAFRYGFPIVLIHLRGVVSKIDDKNEKSIITAEATKRTDSLMVEFLTKNLRMTDILVRMDGENNFLVICPGIENQEANQMMERLIQLSRTREITGFHYAIASFPKDGHSFDELYEQLQK